MDHALSMADDDNMSDVWYNIGHIGVALGDLGLSYQAFKVAVSIDSNHSEALNNIAVLFTNFPLSRRTYSNPSKKCCGIKSRGWGVYRSCNCRE